MAFDRILMIFPSVPENFFSKLVKSSVSLKMSFFICYEAQGAQDSLAIILEILTQRNTPESTNTRNQMLSEAGYGTANKKKKHQLRSPMDKTYQTMSPKTVRSHQEH